jgi:hypothetical protein
MEDNYYSQISIFHKKKVDIDNCLLSERSCEDLSVDDFFSFVDYIVLRKYGIIIFIRIS